ncbi:MAG: type VI secretion system accessory protein TagJ [Planctomycetota bacterium]
MRAIELFNQGELDDAIDAAVAEVKAKPSDVDVRATLADLLCFARDFERADRQLDSIGKLSPGSAHVVSLFRQLVRAETWREDFFLRGRTPEFLSQPDDAVTLQMRASIALREGENGEASELLAAAEEARRPAPCAADDRTFEDIRDCDDLIAGVLELLTSTGKYFWVPFHAVKEIELRPVERPLDRLWRRARVEVEDGPDGEVYLPSIYAPLPADAPDPVRLGRVTEFTESDPIRGIGRRMFLLGEEGVSLDDLPTLRFEGASDA